MSIFSYFKVYKTLFLSIILISLPIFISSQAVAETTLNIAKAFNIKAVNGNQYKTSLFGQNRALKLKPGINLIALEYEEVFESDDADNFDIIKSDTFLLKVYLNKDTQYQQKYIKPYDSSAARKYALNPIFKIVSNSSEKLASKAVDFKISPLKSKSTSYMLDKTSLTQNRSIDLSHPNPKDKVKKSSLLGKNPGEQKPLNAEEMLNYWWQQATTDEKKAFLESIGAESIGTSKE